MKKNILFNNRFVYKKWGAPRSTPAPETARPSPARPEAAAKAPEIRQEQERAAAATRTERINLADSVARLETTRDPEAKKDLALQILRENLENGTTEGAERANQTIAEYCAAKQKEIKERYEPRIKELEDEEEDITDLKAEMEAELAKYTFETVIVILQFGYFETLEEEDELLLARLQEVQDSAITAYKSDDYKDNENLRITDEDEERIRSVSVGALCEKYGEVVRSAREVDEETKEVKGYNYGDADIDFYAEHIQGGAGVADEGPYGPKSRLYTRQIALEFLKERGTKLKPELRARIYVDIANSLLHTEEQQDYNRDLAKEFLEKAISILEEIKVREGTNFSELSTGNTSLSETLSYAYYRYAAVLQLEKEQGEKPDEEICGFYEKSLNENVLDSTITDYIEYLLQYPDNLDRAIEIILKYGIHVTEKPAGKKMEILGWNFSDAAGMVLTRLYDQALRSRKPQELKEWTEKFNRIAQPFFRCDFGAWSGMVGEQNRYREMLGNLNELCRFYIDTNEKTRESQLKYKLFGTLGATVQNEMMERYKNSPITGKNYTALMEGDAHKDARVAGWGTRIEQLNWLFNSEIRQYTKNASKQNLLCAHLLDDWALSGKVDRKKALKYYRKALKDRKGLTNEEIGDAIARCYRILNGPDQYSRTDYLLDIDAAVGEQISWDQDNERYTIENPKENFVVLFYDTEANIGIAINRYINIQAWNAQFNLGDYRELLKRRKELMKNPAKNAKALESIDKEIAELRGKLEPEELGTIQFISKDKNGRLLVCDISAAKIAKRKGETTRQFEVGEDRTISTENIVRYPWEGFSRDSLGLAQYHFSGLGELKKFRADRENLFHPVVDDKGRNLYLTADNNIIQAVPEHDVEQEL